MEELIVEDAGQGYVEMLNRLGVDYVFSSPGSEFIPFWEHLARYNAEQKKPFYLNIRHEGTALSMAKGYYMATGKAQVLMTHVLAGVLHGAMELRAAYIDQIPLMLFVGANRTHDNEVYGGTPGPHYLSFTEPGGQESLVKSIVKWSDNPETNANILGVFQRAYRIANTGVKGPVLLTLSRELMFEKTNKMFMPEPLHEEGVVTADAATLNKLKDLLLGANNPIIYTRYLGRNPAAVNELVKLADLLKIPVFEHPGYTNFPTNNPFHMGTSMQPYLKDSDLILIIDSSAWPPWYPPNSIRGKTNAKLVFIDPDPVQDKYSVYGYPADLSITGDSYSILSQLYNLVKDKKLNGALIQSRKERWEAEHKKIRDEQNQRAIVNETITHGGLIHKYIENHRVEPGNSYESTGPVTHTGLGQGLGVALGVKLAMPKKTVIAFEGDGSFNYNPVPAAFGAAQEHNIPFLTVLFNNSCYAAMKGHARYYPKGYSVTQNQYYGVGCGPTPQYGKLIEAYDGYSETVDDPSDVKKALERVIKETRAGKASLLDVHLAR